MNVFSRYYTWLRGQLTYESSCVLDDSTALSVGYNYDKDLQSTYAGEGWTPFQNQGGTMAYRQFRYQNGSDRSKAQEDANIWQYEYDSGRKLLRALPKEATCLDSTCGTANTSWDRKDFAWDADGRMTQLYDTTLPQKQVCNFFCYYVQQYGKSITLTPDDGYGAVYKSVAVNGATYQYLYDAQGRRRLKVYPVGDTDEYFYEGGALLEDRGQVSLSAPGYIYYTPDMTLDEYIWLGGMPVAVVKTRLTVAFARSTSTNCARNDEYDACGTLYPVSDYLPKVVAMLDSAGKLAGAADYDVFGRVNQVAVRKDVPSRTAPAGSWMPFGTYWQGYSNYLLASLKQPWRTSSQRVKMRVNYAQVNTPGTGLSATDRTWVEAGGTQVAPVFNATFQYHYAGPMMAVTTNWFDVPSSGQASVRWASGSAVPASRYSGATVRSYEYRRYEAGASPTWLPLRFPGQYADAETGLFENWNRFYDPSTGRYSASDPILRTATVGAALGNAPFAYANNQPLAGTDPTGGIFEPSDNASGYAIAQLMRSSDPVTAMNMAKMATDKVNVFAVANGSDPQRFEGEATAALRPGSTDGEPTTRVSKEYGVQKVWMTYWHEGAATSQASGWGFAPSSATALVAHELGHSFFHAYIKEPLADFSVGNGRIVGSDPEALEWENQQRARDGIAPRPWHNPPRRRDGLGTIPVFCSSRLGGYCVP